MPAWWDSLDSVSVFSWWMRWLGVGLTALGAVFGGLALASTKRVETLRAKGDVEAQAKAERVAKEMVGRTGKLEADLEKQQAIARESQNRVQELERAVPRQLTVEQRIALVAALKPYAGQHVMIVQLRAGERLAFPEIEAIAQQIMEVLYEAGWKISEGWWTTQALSQKGIHVAPGIAPLLFGVDKPSRAFQLFVTELQKTNLDVYDIHRGNRESDSHFSEENTEVLIIGKKPQLSIVR